MIHNHCFKVVDRTFRDIHRSYDEANTNTPFGGKIVVHDNDFR